MNYRLTVLRRARFDVESIVYWIAVERKAPQGAASWLNAYEKAVERLQRAPLSYPLAPENDAVEYSLRQFLFRTRRGRTYRGVFTVIDEEIRVLRVRGSGQPPLGAEELSD